MCENKENPVVVECSPRTFHMLQNDPEYMSNVSPDILYSPQDFVPIEDDPLDTFEYDDPGCPELKDVGESSKTVWVDAPIKLLLALVEELEPKVGQTVKFKTKRKMYEHIQSELLANGYQFSVTQIETKYRGLVRKFKLNKNHNNKTGRNRETCLYEKELGNILGKKRGVFPDEILGSSKSLSRKELLEKAGLSTETSNQNNSPDPGVCVVEEVNSTPRIGQNSSRNQFSQMMGELKQMREEKKEFYDKAMKLMEEKAERDKRKMEIMEMLFSSTNTSL